VIDLYYWPTSQRAKITLFSGKRRACRTRSSPVTSAPASNSKPEFLAISPNNRMPASSITRRWSAAPPISVFESRRDFVYLAEKSERFIAQDLRGRVEVTQWLFWQMGGLGPMAGQNHHFDEIMPPREDSVCHRALCQ